MKLTLSPAEREERCRCAQMPLAVYREVAAQLQQVTGVEVELIPAQPAAFDYFASQIGGLRVRYPATIAAAERSQVEAVLAFHGRHYGSWQRDSVGTQLGEDGTVRS